MNSYVKINTGGSAEKVSAFSVMDLSDREAAAVFKAGNVIVWSID